MTAIIPVNVESGPGVLEHPGPWPTLGGGSTVDEGSREQRFWAKTDRTGPTGCWEWTRQRLNSPGVLNYGVVWWDGGTRRAHRVAWQVTNGPIPDGMWVLHRCDNPPCIRPEHLFLGDHDLNMADKVAKGRHKLAGAQARQHGTYSRYVNEKCRCRPCKDAKAEYERNRRSA